MKCDRCHRETDATIMSEFDCADEGGPLDDEIHPIWTWALEAADHYDRYLRESR